MNPVLDYLSSHWLAGVTGIIGWGVGFFADIGKEHLQRKMRLREEHALEIQREVLSPIYTYLNSFYLPVCQFDRGMLDVTCETVKRQPKDITQDCVETYRLQINATTPVDINPKSSPGYEYWRESESFRRYFEDAQRNHHPKLLGRWVTFNGEFEAMRLSSIKAAESFVVTLQSRLKLPAREDWGNSETPTWANYEAIAVFIVHRRLGIDNLALKRYASEVKTSGTQQQVLKCATPEEAQEILGLIDKIANDSSQVEPIRAECELLQTIAIALINDFRFTVSKKPELKRCPFV